MALERDPLVSREHLLTTYVQTAPPRSGPFTLCSNGGVPLSADVPDKEGFLRGIPVDLCVSTARREGFEGQGGYKSDEESKIKRESNNV